MTTSNIIELTSMKFLDLPEELLVHVLSFLSLRDFYSATAACKGLQAFLSCRGIYMTLLSRASQQVPIHLRACEDISRLSLGTLQSIAKHTLRLASNWARDDCALYGSTPPVRVLEGGLTHAIACVPGTSLVILHRVEVGQLVLWDLGAQKPALDTITLKDTIHDVSQPYEEEGLFALAIIASDRSEALAPATHLFVIIVEHGANPRPSSMRQTFHTMSEPWTSWWCHAFLHEDVVGVHQASAPPDSVRAWNMYTGACVRIECPEYYGIHRTACYVHDRALYFVAEDATQIIVHRYPPHRFPYGALSPAVPNVFQSGSTYDVVHSPSPHELSSRVDTDEATDPEMSIYLMPGVITHGVGAFLIRQDTPSSSSTFKFYPSSPSPTDRGKLTFGPPLSLEYPGTLRILASNYQNPWNAARAVVLLWDAGTGPGNLKLVIVRLSSDGDAHVGGEFVHGRRWVSVHRLESPPDILLGSIASVAMNEGKGEVVLVDLEGRVSSARYA